MIHNRYLRDNVFFEQLALLSVAILRVRTSDTMAGREIFYVIRDGPNLAPAEQTRPLFFLFCEQSPKSSADLSRSSLSLMRNAYMRG